MHLRTNIVLFLFVGISCLLFAALGALLAYWGVDCLIEGLVVLQEELSKPVLDVAHVICGAIMLIVSVWFGTLVYTCGVQVVKLGRELFSYWPFRQAD